MGVRWKQKKLSTNYTLASLTIIPNAKYRIASQTIKGVSLKESEIACNLQALAENVLEPLRVKYPGFNINSGFRLGSNQSQHGTGEACDLQWIGKDRKFLLEVCMWARDNLNYDQIVYEVPEPGSGNPYTQHAWMHISYSRGVGPFKGNRQKSNVTKNITYRGYGDRYYKQYEINWDKIQFANDSSGVLRPVLGSGSCSPSLAASAPTPAK